MNNLNVVVTKHKFKAPKKFAFEEKHFMINKRFVEIFQSHNLKISFTKQHLILLSPAELTFQVITNVFVMFQYKNIVSYVFFFCPRNQKKIL